MQLRNGLKLAARTLLRGGVCIFQYFHHRIALFVPRAAKSKISGTGVFHILPAFPAFVHFSCCSEEQHYFPWKYWEAKGHTSINIIFVFFPVSVDICIYYRVIYGHSMNENIHKGYCDKGRRVRAYIFGQVWAEPSPIMQFFKRRKESVILTLNINTVRCIDCRLLLRVFISGKWQISNFAYPSYWWDFFLLHILRLVLIGLREKNCS